MILKKIFQAMMAFAFTLLVTCLLLISGYDGPEAIAAKVVVVLAILWSLAYMFFPEL